MSPLIVLLAPAVLVPVLAFGHAEDRAVFFADDSCKCTVVNRMTVGTASGTCTIAGQGSVPCFTYGAATYPQGGQPQDGTCIHTPQCNGTNSCTYKTMRVAVTIASCATSCGVSNPVPWKLDNPPAVGNPTTGTQGINTTANHDVGAGNLSTVCGTGEVTIPLIFYKSDGLTAFKLDFTFGCGQCPAKIGS